MITEGNGCPTCSHTLGCLCVHEGMQFVNCEQCGTVVVRILEGGYPDRVYVPKLVERCRTFEKKTVNVGAVDEDQLKDRWQITGIAESINRPEDRP